MDKDQEIKQWFALASQDIAVAEHISKNMWPTPDEQICFLCQQSVEKYLKGYLVLHDIIPPRIHDLTELCKLCEELADDFSRILLDCADLTQYGVMPRYPNELELNTDDVKRALRHANEIKQFVIKNSKFEESNV
jgi:HEPN domain-containing protein